MTLLTSIDTLSLANRGLFHASTLVDVDGSDPGISKVGHSCSFCTLYALLRGRRAHIA